MPVLYYTYIAVIAGMMPIWQKMLPSSQIDELITWKQSLYDVYVVLRYTKAYTMPF